MLDRRASPAPKASSTSRATSDARARIFDFATGSGGFLVEAARRVIDEVGLRSQRATRPRDGLRAIVRGLHGCEISPFPYYLTEVNLLLQVSRLLGRLRDVGEEPRRSRSASSTRTRSALGAARATASRGSTPRTARTPLLLASTSATGIVPLDADKEPRFDEIRRDEAFDLVIGNPPYVFESGNKVLFDRLRALPGWTRRLPRQERLPLLLPRMAAEKLAPGGRLCVITPAGWMNAGNADWLRERIASSLRLDELYLFGSMRLFATEHEERDVRERDDAADRRERDPRRDEGDRARRPPSARRAARGRGGGGARAHGGCRGTRHPARAAAGDDGRAGDAAARAARRESSSTTSRRTACARRGRGRSSTRRADVAARVVAISTRSSTTPTSPVERSPSAGTSTQGIETGADAYSRSRATPPAGAHALGAGRPRAPDSAIRSSSYRPAPSVEPPWTDHPELPRTQPRAARAALRSDRRGELHEPRLAARRR